MKFDIPLDAVAKAVGHKITETWAPPDKQDYRCLNCEATWYAGDIDQLDPPGDCNHADVERITPCCGNPIDEDIPFCSCGSRI